MNRDDEGEAIVAFEPGCAGKARLLELALLEVITRERYADMTLAEVLGTLEMVKRTLLEELNDHSSSTLGASPK
jgi:hypothetical protein